MNNKENDIQKLHKAQKLTLYWLLGFIYAAFIGMQLGRIQAITDFNYNLHEMMFMPFTIAIIAVPVLFLIYIYYLTKYLSARGKQKITLKTSVQAVLVIASLIFVVSITNHQFQEASTSGVFEVEKKEHENRGYYLVINGKKVKVSRNEFHLVEENQKYVVNFIWNKRTPDKGRLETIEPLRIR